MKELYLQQNREKTIKGRCLCLDKSYSESKQIIQIIQTHFSVNLILDIGMFTDSLPSRLLSSSKSLKNLLNPQQQKSCDLTDLQFELCSNFLRQTKEKLYHQEAELLAMNESLINKVQEKAAFMNFSSSQKDISASQDTTMFSFQGQDEEDVFSQSCKSMLILRKSKSTTCMRRTQSDYSLILRQIQAKCSQRTVQTITKLIEENRRLKERNSNIEKKEKQFNKKQLENEKQQQQMYLLKKKAAQHDKVITALNDEIVSLKSRLRQGDSSPTPSHLKRAKSPSHDMPLPQIIEIQTSLKLFLSQKQHTITQSTKRLKQLYIQVQKKIQAPFTQSNQACDKCCMMLKKIKGSILKYRELMEAEATAVEGLYERFRAKWR